MFQLTKECGENLAIYIENVTNKDVEMKEIAAKYTTDVIATCAFGITANCFKNENSEFRIASRKLFQRSFYGTLQMFSYTFAPVAVKIFKFQFVNPQIADFLRGVFMETMAQRETVKNKQNDLIDILIDLKNQETRDDEFKF
ncbi:hypothetical protein ILUMI_14761, partial [Ignelater luminosus]